jgi:EAL domain-containing protein (putative c-di-GMP-specific phosphodiesterase class I)
VTPASAIITITHGLQMKVIVKGIETELQWEFLKEHKCSYAQG